MEPSALPARMAPMGVSSLPSFAASSSETAALAVKAADDSIAAERARCLILFLCMVSTSECVGSVQGNEIPICVGLAVGFNTVDIHRSTQAVVALIGELHVKAFAIIKCQTDVVIPALFLAKAANRSGTAINSVAGSHRNAQIYVIHYAEKARDKRQTHRRCITGIVGVYSFRILVHSQRPVPRQLTKQCRSI